MQARYLAAIVGVILLGSPGMAHSGSMGAHPGQIYESERELRLRSLDSDNDGVITRSEWLGTPEGFRRHDTNGDGVLSGDEVRQLGSSDNPTDAAELRAVFNRADRNGDRMLSEEEWYGDRSVFARLDRNRDGAISRGEFVSDARASRGTTFAELDRNRNGVITRNEWDDDLDEFRRFDADGDGVLTRAEYREARIGSSIDEDRAIARADSESAAFRAGRERGLSDGREAGQRDRIKRGRWDLEGQRELETADAGYSPVVGSREDYQSGYRAGFRQGYRDGFGRQ